MPYFFFQTLPPVTLGDKPHKVNALLLAEREWNQLKYNLQWKEHEAAAVAAALAKREAIKNKSDDLKKNWRDTVNNIRQKQLEAREARYQGYMAERMERFHEAQREKEEEKRLFLEACETLRFYEKDDIKSLNKAMVFSETLREREKQVEFEKMLQAIEDAREAEYAAKVKKDVLDYLAEEKEKEEAALAKRKKNQQEILQQLKEREEGLRTEKETNERLEREDMENLRKEMKIGEQMEREALEKERQGVRKNTMDALQEDRACKQAKKVEEDEEDRVIAVYAEAKQRIAKMCKERTKEIQDEAVRQREKIKEKLGAQAKMKEDDENERIRRAVEQRDAAEEKVRQKKEAYQKRIIQERLQDHHNFLEKDAKRKEDERQMKKWEMLQRFKAEEVNEEFEKEMQRKVEESMVTRKAELDKQIADDEKRMEGQRDSDLYALEKAYWEKEDAKFFKYADQLLEESKKVGRPLMPIEREIYAYRSKNNLLPRKQQGPEHRSSIPFARAKDKSNMDRKRTGRHGRPKTPLPGQCTCGPILCTCHPVVCACPPWQ